MSDTASMNKRSKEEVARLIVTTLLVSESSKYISAYSQRQLSETLVLKNPVREIKVSYRLNDSGDYSAEIGDLRVAWTSDGPEVIDEEGNVWSPRKLKFEISVGSFYRVSLAEFSKRTDCIATIQSTVEKCIDILPGTLYEMTHSNEERIVRDKETKRALMTDMLTVAVKKFEGGKLLKGHRSFGGKPRPVPVTILGGIDPGSYVILQTYGPKFSPKFKKYEVYIPASGSTLRPYIRRIS